MARRALSSSPPIASSRLEAVELGHGGLTLVPRMRFHISFKRADLSVKPVDEWQLRQSLLSFVRNSLHVSVSDNDLSLHKRRDSHKNRRDEALPSGMLYIWDIQALQGGIGGPNEDPEVLLKKKEESILDKLTGVELNLSGLKLRCQVQREERDDFDLMKQSWHETREKFNKESPDTLVLKGIPSRWMAELRVSSKASVLVIHTIFSHFGTIRNVDVQDSDSEAYSCDIWVQYESYSSFYNAIRAFCGRSMIKEGSNFQANYELNWDNSGYFTERNIRKRRFEKERLEESRRRQLIMEAQQAEVARRQAAFSKMEQERLENERLEQLREEEKRRAVQEAERQRELERLAEEQREQEQQRQREEEQLQRQRDEEQLQRQRDEEQQRLLKIREDESTHREQMQREEERTLRNELLKRQGQKTEMKKDDVKKDNNQYSMDLQRQEQRREKHRAWEMEPSMNHRWKNGTDESRYRHDSPGSSEELEFRRESNEEKTSALQRYSDEAPHRLQDQRRNREQERLNELRIREAEHIYMGHSRRDVERSSELRELEGEQQWRGRQKKERMEDQKEEIQQYRKDCQRQEHKRERYTPREINRHRENGIDQTRNRSPKIVDEWTQNEENMFISQRHPEESFNSQTRWQDDSAEDAYGDGERWVLCSMQENQVNHVPAVEANGSGYSTKRLRSVIVNLRNTR